MLGAPFFPSPCFLLRPWAGCLARGGDDCRPGQRICFLGELSWRRNSFYLILLPGMPTRHITGGPSASCSNRSGRGGRPPMIPKLTEVEVKINYSVRRSPRAHSAPTAVSPLPDRLCCRCTPRSKEATHLQPQRLPFQTPCSALEVLLALWPINSWSPALRAATGLLLLHTLSRLL